MRISLVEIRHSDERNIADVAAGESVTDAVLLEVNGTLMQFQVSILAKPLPGFDGSLVNGEFPLEELLRFEPEALARLYSLVGKSRRGRPIQLPVLLVTRSDATDEVGIGS